MKTTLCSPGDLLKFPLILPTLPEFVLELFRQFFKKTSDKFASIKQLASIQSNDMSVIKNTVSNSDAIGIATYGTVNLELKQKQFVALPLLIPKLKTNYGILKKQGLSLSPAALAFSDILVETDAALSKQEKPFIESLIQTP